jgi:hypothetical protein
VRALVLALASTIAIVATGVAEAVAEVAATTAPRPSSVRRGTTGLSGRLVVTSSRARADDNLISRTGRPRSDLRWPRRRPSPRGPRGLL